MMDWKEVLIDDLKGELQSLLEVSEGLKSLEDDLRKHCETAHQFISNQRGVHKASIVLRALELSLGAAADQDSDFFSEFDEDGLKESLEMAIKDDANEAKDWMDERDEMYEENARFRVALEKYADARTHSMDPTGEIWYADYFDYQTAQDALAGIDPSPQVLAAYRAALEEKE